MEEKNYDALIIGGGPAGAAAGAVLAMKGRGVLIIEKEKFPRYRIGESMLPYCYFTLERIGVLEKVRQIGFTKKYSVQFASVNGKISRPYYFFQHYDHPSSTTWQVERGLFDQILLDHAREKGAQVLEETKVRNLLRDEKDTVCGVEAQRRNGETARFHAPIVIDASGRASLAVTRNRWRVPDKELERVAIWTYYKGALRDEGYDAGATTIAYLPGKGWFWYIPLRNDLVSVGMVAKKEYLYAETRDPATIFQKEARKNPWIARHLAPGTQQGDYRVTGDFAYRSKYCAEDGLVLTGDAFAFLDPVFSSGLFFALMSGEMAGEAAERAIDEQDFSAAQFADYSERMCAGVEAMRKVVYAFYDQDFSFRVLFQNHPDVRPDVTDVLIGNLFKNFDNLFDAMGRLAHLPEPLSHGRPKSGS